MNGFELPIHKLLPSAIKIEIPVKMSVSIGCASCIPNESISHSDFLNFADKALYTAKAEGRNCVIKAVIPENKNKAA